MYKKVKRYEVPTRERKSESRFESAQEWKSMKADIDKGLRKGESCYLRMAARDWERLGLSGEPQAGRNTSTGSKAAQRFIQKYLTERELDYKVRVIHRDGYDYVIVDGPDPDPE